MYTDNFESLEKVKKTFWENHERRMKELTESMGNLNKPTLDNRIDKQLDQISKDLDDLLKD